LNELLKLFREEERENVCSVVKLISLIFEVTADLKAIIEAGVAHGQQLSTDELEHPFYFLTANMGIINNCLTDKTKAKEINRIINDFGLEHLIPVKALSTLNFDE
jgi:hypothetical protein